MIRNLYDCIHTGSEFAEGFYKGFFRADDGNESLLNFALEIVDDWDTFRALMILGLREDPSFIGELARLADRIETECLQSGEEPTPAPPHTPAPTPAVTPQPTPAPTSSPTPQPTGEPGPSLTADLEVRWFSGVFDCLQEKGILRESFRRWAEEEGVRGGIATEKARTRAETLLGSRDFFISSMRESLREDEGTVGHVIGVQMSHEFCADRTASLAPASLEEYAAKYASRPGAIYAGDLSQLADPAPGQRLGDSEGNVPLDAILQHRWIYESDYYQALLERAKLTNPTTLTTREGIRETAYICLNRDTLPCMLVEDYLAPNLWARTNGQIKLVVLSLPEERLAGPDTLRLMLDGGIASLYGAYIEDELPMAGVQSLWGIYPDHQTAFESAAKLLPLFDEALTRETGGGVVISHGWFPGNDQFLYSRKPLRDKTDTEGLRASSHSASLSDWLDGMGAEPRHGDYSQVRRELEAGLLDAAVTDAATGHGRRWHEVTGYMNGPLTSWPSSSIVVSAGEWDRMPADLQQILLEEAARAELEQLRLASIQNLAGLQQNLDDGTELVEFLPELAHYSFSTAATGHVIPGWLTRLGYPGTGAEAVAMFNKGVGPYVGLHIRPDGSVVGTLITEGPHAGKTMSQVLLE